MSGSATRRSRGVNAGQDERVGLPEDERQGEQQRRVAGDGEGDDERLGDAERHGLGGRWSVGTTARRARPARVGGLQVGARAAAPGRAPPAAPGCSVSAPSAALPPRRARARRAPGRSPCRSGRPARAGRCPCRARWDSSSGWLTNVEDLLVLPVAEREGADEDDEAPDQPACAARRGGRRGSGDRRGRSGEGRPSRLPRRRSGAGRGPVLGLRLGRRGGRARRGRAAARRGAPAGSARRRRRLPSALLVLAPCR